MKLQDAKDIISFSFKNASLQQFKNQMEWLLNGEPLLEPELSLDAWSKECIPWLTGTAFRVKDGEYDPAKSKTMHKTQRDAMQALFYKNSANNDIIAKHGEDLSSRPAYYYFDAQVRLGRRGINQLMRQEADRRGYEMTWVDHKDTKTEHFAI